MAVTQLRRMAWLTVLGMAATVIPVAGCAATGCTPPAGGRCAGPAPISTWLHGPLTLSADGRTISGRFGCGGRLSADETPSTVTITFHASAVKTAGLSCAMIELQVRIRAVLGARVVKDGVTGEVLEVHRL